MNIFLIILKTKLKLTNNKLFAYTKMELNLTNFISFNFDNFNKSGWKWDNNDHYYCKKSYGRERITLQFKISGYNAMIRQLVRIENKYQGDLKLSLRLLREKISYMIEKNKCLDTINACDNIYIKSLETIVE